MKTSSLSRDFLHSGRSRIVTFLFLDLASLYKWQGEWMVGSVSTHQSKKRMVTAKMSYCVSVKMEQAWFVVKFVGDNMVEASLGSEQTGGRWIFSTPTMITHLPSLQQLDLRKVSLEEVWLMVHHFSVLDRLVIKLQQVYTHASVCKWVFESECLQVFMQWWVWVC